MKLPVVILFADRHYGAAPGRAQAELLRPFCKVHYIEEDYSALIAALAAHPEATLAFNSIAGTPGNPAPAPELEAPLKAHLAAGRPLWILHGGSAACWPWAWWRQLMPLRWVRNGDPDQMPVSTHPVVPLHLVATPAALAFFPNLPAITDLPTDELYIKLAAQHSFETWLTINYEGVDYPQACSATSAWGGAIHCFLPGHSAEALGHPAYAVLFTALARKWLSA